MILLKSFSLLDNLEMDKRYLALIAAFLATSIYGINHTVAKEVMPIYIGSSGFIMLRLLGATSIFWLISLFTPSEKIESKDFIKTVDSLMKFWAEFDKEQPGLSKILSKELIKFKKSGEKSAFLQAAWIVYRSLQVQLEVDNLNKDWEL